MKPKKIYAFLEGARQGSLLVNFRRSALDDLYENGVVVGLSDTWVLMHLVENNSLRFNGYVGLRLEDIDKVKLNTSFMTRALALNGEVPVAQPDILLIDLPGLLSSANSLFPLLNIHEEEKWPDTFSIGRVAKITGKTLSLREVTPRATWRDKPERHRLKHITRVEFGGGYETALWRVAEQERRLMEQEADNDK